MPDPLFDPDWQAKDLDSYPTEVQEAIKTLLNYGMRNDALLICMLHNKEGQQPLHAFLVAGTHSDPRYTTGIVKRILEDIQLAGGGK